LPRKRRKFWKKMRILAALVAAAALNLASCVREADTRVGAEADENVQEELAEAGEAVGDAAVEVGEAARVAIQDAAETADENADKEEEPEAEAPAQP
jgi:hypothetical protein